MQRRYESLRLREALNRRFDYAKACRELAGLIKSAYPSASKGLQAVMFQDVLVAFRKLPEMDMSRQLSAANLLLQSLEGALPRQKKSLAVSEYKQAAVAQRRCHKQHFEKFDYVQFPLDILISIFRFLDIHSLATTSLVCRAWNIAAQDDTLWRTHFLLTFENVDVDSHIFLRAGFDICATYTAKGCEQRNVETHQQGCWKNAFALALEGRLGILKSNRAYCSTCKAVCFPSQSPMQAAHDGCRHQNGLRPIDCEEVASFILTGRIVQKYSSSSDSDSDGETDVRGHFSRMWTYPMIFHDSDDL